MPLLGLCLNYVIVTMIRHDATACTGCLSSRERSSNFATEHIIHTSTLVTVFTVRVVVVVIA